MVSAREPDCPPKSGVARVGHLVPVSIVVDECGESEKGSESKCGPKSRKDEVTDQWHGVRMRIILIRHIQTSS